MSETAQEKEEKTQEEPDTPSGIKEGLLTAALGKIKEVSNGVWDKISGVLKWGEDMIEKIDSYFSGPKNKKEENLIHVKTPQEAVPPEENKNEEDETNKADEEKKPDPPESENLKDKSTKEKPEEKKTPKRTPQRRKKTKSSTEEDKEPEQEAA